MSNLVKILTDDAAAALRDLKRPIRFLIADRPDDDNLIEVVLEFIKKPFDVVFAISGYYGKRYFIFFHMCEWNMLSIRFFDNKKNTDLF